MAQSAQPDISSLGYDSQPMVTKFQSTAGTELSWPQWYPEEAGLWLLTYLLQDPGEGLPWSPSG